MFDTITVDPIAEPELAEFVQIVKNEGPRFNNYPKDKIEHFANRIYELRKNYGDNTA